MPNFVAITSNMAEISRFFDISTWRPPPSWIFKIETVNRVELLNHAYIVFARTFNYTHFNFKSDTYFDDKFRVYN